MKVIAQTAALAEALGLVGSIAAGRTPKPVLQCVKMIAADGVLTLLATDLEVGCRYQLPQVEVLEEGDALIPADRLSAIVRESQQESTLTLEVQKETCTITGAGSRFTIYGFDPAEFPPVADFGDQADAKVESAQLTGMISRTLFATAKEHSRYAISGVLLEVQGKRLQLVATDGRRLALTKGPLAEAARDFSAIVPTKLMSLIQRVAGSAEQTLELRLAESQILIRSAHAVLVGNLVQGNFPNYTDVVPKEAVHKATIEADPFLRRIRQAALLTNEESKGVALSFEAGQLTMTSRAPETGEAEVTLPIDYEGEPLRIGFNPAYLTDALKVVHSEKITLEFNGPTKPGLLKSGVDFLYVLMPVDLG